MKFRSITFENNKLVLIDQRYLPYKEEYFYCETSEEVVYAIKEMVVRGAPAIGASAAYGVVLAHGESETFQIFKEKIFLRGI